MHQEIFIFSWVHVVSNFRLFIENSSKVRSVLCRGKASVITVRQWKGLQHFPFLTYYLMSLLQKEYKVELILKETWKDPRLAYGNATWFVRLKNELLKKIWYPDTMIENARKHDVDDKTRTAYLFGDGTIFFSEWFVWLSHHWIVFHRVQYGDDGILMKMMVVGTMKILAVTFHPLYPLHQYAYPKYCLTYPPHCSLYVSFHMLPYRFLDGHRLRE